MNHSLGRARSSQSRNCRNSVTSLRVRRDRSAARLEKQWHEICRHATIETDPEKLLRLRAELNRRKRQVEATGKRNGN
jgi:hypothetical protein